MAAAVASLADTVVRADSVAADRAGRALMTASPAGALVGVDTAPPRRRTGDAVYGGNVQPKAVPTSAEIPAGNVDAFRGHRVA